MEFADEEAEKMLISFMVFKPEIIPNVYDTVKPSVFFYKTWALVYEKLIDMSNRNAPIDEATVAMEIRGTVSVVDFANVCSLFIGHGDWNFYAEKVKSKFYSRQAMVILKESLAELNESNGADVINKTIERLLDISSTTSSCVTYDMNTLIQGYIQKLDDAISNKKQFTGYASGLSNLDEVIGGIQKEYTVIAARPSLGKTALAEQIALNVSGCMGGEGQRTLFIELEMTPEQLTERAIANISKMSIKRMRTGLLNYAQLGKVMTKMQILAENKNFVPVTCNDRCITDIVSCIRSEVRTKGAKIVFIDHAGLVKPAGKYKSEWEGAKEISHTLQNLQRELNVPIILLSQVTRDVEGKPPTLADIRGSGSFEEDADSIIFVHRDRIKDAQESLVEAELIVAKNRNGQCGTVPVNFHPNEVMFSDREVNTEKKEPA